jgi:hypothetical protein
VPRDERYSQAEYRLPNIAVANRATTDSPPGEIAHFSLSRLLRRAALMTIKK